jgi:hypothetical protein
MKRYWQFAVVGLICLLAALLWAQPVRSRAEGADSTSQNAVVRTAGSTPQAAPDSPHSTKAGDNDKNSDNDDQPLPGSSSSLPVLAVIGFGVLAGGITSAMRTR